MLALLTMAPPAGTKSGHEDDVVPVAKPVRRPSSRRKTLKLVQLPAWIGAVCSVAGLVFSIVALARVSSSDSVKLAVELNGLRKDMDVALKWIRLHDANFPAARAVPTSTDAPPPAPSPLPSTQPVDSVLMPPIGSGTVAPQLDTLPSSVSPREPPDCVSRAYHRLIPCERATNCVGKEGYKPEFWRQIREKAGAGDWMMLCDTEKAP